MITLINAVVFGAGFLTLTSNPTGNKLAILAFSLQIALVYGPKVTHPEEGEDWSFYFFEVVKAMTGILASYNLLSRPEVRLHTGSKETQKKLLAIINERHNLSIKGNQHRAVEWAK